MSKPTFPDNPNINREDAINQILSSIAYEELGLSHIINAEGEKVQYSLGTIPGVTGPNATIEDILNINKSVQNTLQAAANNQMFLNQKMQTALNSVVLQGPTGPTGPAGSEITSSFIHVQATNLQNLDALGDFIFNEVVAKSSDIDYDYSTGYITFNSTKTYYVSWKVSFMQMTAGNYYSTTLVSSKGDKLLGTTAARVGELSGAGIIEVYNPGETINLISDNNDVKFAGPLQANLIVFSIG